MDSTRAPYALLGVKRTASDAAVERAWAQARTLHSPASSGGEVAHMAVRDAYARVCQERGIVPSTPDALAAAAAPDPGAAEYAPVSEACTFAEPVAVPRAGHGAEPVRDVTTKERRIALGGDAGPDLPLSAIVGRMRAIDAPVVKGRLESCRADRMLGLLWLIALKAYAEHRGNLSAKQSARHVLRMRYERLRLCARLAVGWPEFLRAYRWITSRAAREAGWVAKARDGAPWAVEIMGLHPDFLNGLGPTDREDAAEAKRHEREAERRGEPSGTEPEDHVRAAEAEVARLDDARRKAVEDAAWATRGAAEMQRRAEASGRRAAFWKSEAKRLRAALLANGLPVARWRP